MTRSRARRGETKEEGEDKERRETNLDELRETTDPRGPFLLLVGPDGPAPRGNETREGRNPR